MEFRTAIFSQEAMERLASHYIRILEQVTSDSEVLLENIRVLGEEERESISKLIRANRSPEFDEFDF
ncbi:hypothetical protein D3C78_1958580 [compost metagenome]